MGIILGFSFVITFIVITIQLLVFAGGLILLCFFSARFVPLLKKKLFLSISIGGVQVITAILFIVMLWSYLNYVTDAALSRSQVPDTIFNRYWKENLGSGTIGTVSFMNPILKPRLYFLPRTSDESKNSPSKLNGQGAQ